MNVNDVLSNAGGTYASVNVLGAVIASIFSYDLMMSSLINKLYFFKPRFDSEIKQKKEPDPSQDDGKDNDPSKPKKERLDKNNSSSSDSNKEENGPDEEKPITDAD